jgi:hypothetical protein
MGILLVIPLVTIFQSLTTSSSAKLKSTQDNASPCLNPTTVSNCSEKLF